MKLGELFLSKLQLCDACCTAGAMRKGGTHDCKDEREVEEAKLAALRACGVKASKH